MLSGGIQGDSPSAVATAWKFADTTCGERGISAAEYPCGCGGQDGTAGASGSWAGTKGRRWGSSALKITGRRPSPRASARFMIVATVSVIPFPPVAGLPTILPPSPPPPAEDGAAPFGDRTGGSDFPTVATANRTARVATTAAAAARA